MKLAAALTAFLFAAPALAADWSYDTITAADGVPLVVAETGNADGPPLLFIHGYSQSILSWKEQLNDPALQAAYRMVAFDLRGHGASCKPWTTDAYTSQDWGDDVAAVIAAKQLDKPVLIGWSFGGSVMMAYLRHHGEADISGLIFAGGAMALEPRPPMPTSEEGLPPETAKILRSMTMMGSPDIATNLAGTRGFVADLAAVDLPQETMDEALIYNMMLPAYVRDAMGHNQTSYEDMANKIALPALLIHGTEDALVPVDASVRNQQLIPGSELITYSEIGHAPFLEDPARFNSDVRTFVAKINR
jgi:non-heme chloroperoxidase